MKEALSLDTGAGSHVLRLLAGTKAILRDKRHRPPIVPTLIILAFVVLSVFPAQIAPAEPNAVHLSDRLLAPQFDNWVGTDHLGRDILSRIIAGARVSLTVGVLAIIVGGAIGITVALIAGYVGGLADAVLMRLVDGALAIPLILVALLLAVISGPSEGNVILVIGALIWAQYARVLRAEVLSVREREYVTASRALGASAPRIVVFHIFPNIAVTFIVLLTNQLGIVILIEASLSFLGAGVPPPAPAWGTMVAEGRDFIATSWWVSLFPGLAIMLVVLAFNLLGDWMRDALDPRMRGG